MPDLRERLRASDPAGRMRPLDPVELRAMRRAMREAAPSRWPAVAKLAAAAAAAAALATALLVRQGPEGPVPPEAALPEQASLAVLPSPPPPVPPSGAGAVETPAPPLVPATSSAREVRFVTARGTQIVWTFRSPEEGA